MIIPFGMGGILFRSIRIDGELEDIFKQLNDEDNKKCLETMTLYLLGDKIKATLGNRVEVRFIEP
jgi:hypothetical protein